MSRPKGRVTRTSPRTTPARAATGPPAAPSMAHGLGEAGPPGNPSRSRSPVPSHAHPPPSLPSASFPPSPAASNSSLPPNPPPSTFSTPRPRNAHPSGPNQPHHPRQSTGQTPSPSSGPPSGPSSLPLNTHAAEARAEAEDGETTPQKDLNPVVSRFGHSYGYGTGHGATKPRRLQHHDLDRALAKAKLDHIRAQNDPNYRGHVSGDDDDSDLDPDLHDLNPPPPRRRQTPTRKPTPGRPTPPSQTQPNKTTPKKGKRKSQDDVVYRDVDSASDSDDDPHRQAPTPARKTRTRSPQTKAGETTTAAARITRSRTTSVAPSQPPESDNHHHHHGHDRAPPPPSTPASLILDSSRSFGSESVIFHNTSLRNRQPTGLENNSNNSNLISSSSSTTNPESPADMPPPARKRALATHDPVIPPPNRASAAARKTVDTSSELTRARAVKREDGSTRSSPYHILESDEETVVDPDEQLRSEADAYSESSNSSHHNSPTTIASQGTSKMWSLLGFDADPPTTTPLAHTVPKFRQRLSDAWTVVVATRPLRRLYPIFLFVSVFLFWSLLVPRTHWAPEYHDVQWYGWDQMTLNVGQLVPFSFDPLYGRLRSDPSSSSSDHPDPAAVDSTWELRKIRTELQQLRASYEKHDKTIRQLEKLLPDLVVMDVDRRGQRSLPEPLMQALRDALREVTPPASSSSSSSPTADLAASLPEPLAETLMKTKAWARFLRENDGKVDLVRASANEAALTQKEEVVRYLDQELRRQKASIRSNVLDLMPDVEKRIEEAVRRTLPGQMDQLRGHVSRLVHATLAQADVHGLVHGRLGSSRLADLRNKVNYFSPGAGAHVDASRSSPSYDPSLVVGTQKRKSGDTTGAGSVRAQNLVGWLAGFQRAVPPLTDQILRPFRDAGDCWCAVNTTRPGGSSGGKKDDRVTTFQGAFFTVLMARQVLPSHVVWEHALPGTTLDEDAVPQHVEVWAYYPHEPLRDKVRAFSRQYFAESSVYAKAGAVRTDKMVYSPPSDEEPEWVLVGEFVYRAEDAVDGAYVHRLPEDLVRLQAATTEVRMVARTNAGGAKTCFYRVQLYGETLGGDAR